jgi:hypothetical protein
MRALQPWFSHRSFARKRSPPGRAACVLADQERAVPCNCDAVQAIPDGRVVHDKAGAEILVFSGRRRPVARAYLAM